MKNIQKKHLNVLMSLALGLCSFPSFSSDISITPAIYNGTDSELTDVPYQLRALITKNDGTNDTEYLCGGVAFADNGVLIAAHCVDETDGAETTSVEITYMDYSDSDNPVENTFTVDPENIKINPDWTGSVNDANDIAVIYLPDSDLSNAKKVKIADDDEVDDMFSQFEDEYVSGQDTPGNTLASGYGYDEDGNIDTLSRVLLAGLPKDSCNEVKGSGTDVDDTICVQSTSQTVNYSICSGDSGGPLVWIDQNNSSDDDYGIRLVGVASYTMADDEGNCYMTEGYHGGYTNINYYKDFVNDAMATFTEDEDYDYESLSISYSFDSNPFEGVVNSNDDSDDSSSSTKGAATGGSINPFVILGISLIPLFRNRKKKIKTVGKI